MKEFLESGAGLYVLLSIGFLGMLIKLFADISISRLVRQSKCMGETRDRQLKQWKSKFENAYRINHGINNVYVYVSKNLKQYRVAGIPIERLDRVNLVFAGVSALVTFAFAGFMYKMHMKLDLMTWYCLLGVLLTGAMLLWELVCGTSGKKESILINMQDFYENSLAKKLELGKELKDSERRSEARKEEPARVKKYAPIEELKFPDESVKNNTEARRRDRVVVPALDKNPEAARRRVAPDRNASAKAKTQRNSREQSKDVDYLKQSFDRIAAGREPEYVQPTRNLTQNEEKLIEDFIREYLS